MASTRPSTAPHGNPTTLSDESYVAALVDGVVVVRWLTDSNAAAFPPLARFIADAARSRGKVDLLAIVHPLRSVPDADRAAAVRDLATSTRETVDTTHVVLVGKSGFWQTIVRSMLTSLMLLVGKHRNVKTHQTVDDAVAAVCQARGLDARTWYGTVSALLDRLEQETRAAG